jgi:hypothetical protein
MKKESRSTIAPVALVLVLAVLVLLVVNRKPVTTEEAEVGAVQEVVKLENMILKDDYTVAAFLTLIALFALVIWTGFRAEREGKAKPPAKESSASGTSSALSS